MAEAARRIADAQAQLEKEARAQAETAAAQAETARAQAKTAEAQARTAQALAHASAKEQGAANRALKEAEAARERLAAAEEKAREALDRAKELADSDVTAGLGDGASPEATAASARPARKKPAKGVDKSVAAKKPPAPARSTASNPPEAAAKGA